MLAECSGALVDGVGALDATGIRFSEVFEPPQIGCITEWPGAPSDLSGSRARATRRSQVDMSDRPLLKYFLKGTPRRTGVSGQDERRGHMVETCCPQNQPGGSQSPVPEQRRTAGMSRHISR